MTHNSIETVLVQFASCVCGQCDMQQAPEYACVSALISVARPEMRRYKSMHQQTQVALKWSIGYPTDNSTKTVEDTDVSDQ